MSHRHGSAKFTVLELSYFYFKRQTYARQKYFR